MKNIIPLLPSLNLWLIAIPLALLFVHVKAHNPYPYPSKSAIEESSVDEDRHGSVDLEQLKASLDPSAHHDHSYQHPPVGVPSHPNPPSDVDTVMSKGVPHTHTHHHKASPPSHMNDIGEYAHHAQHAPSNHYRQDASKAPNDLPPATHHQHHDDQYYDEEYTPAPFEDYIFVHDCLSWLHAVLCIFCYSIIIFKVTKDQTALGLSLQSICALCFSELLGISITFYFSIFHAYPLDISFIFLDGFSLVLSLYCLYITTIKFKNSYEDQYDTFGLNLINLLLIKLHTGHVDPNDLKKENGHAGTLSPRGKLGSCIQRSYWLVLYILAIPLAILFVSFRGLPHIDTITGLLAYDDAVRALSLLPQVYMFHAKFPRQISEHLAIFVLCEGFLKFIAFVYWLSLPLFRPYATESRNYNLVVQLLNFFAIGDFAFHYVKGKIYKSQGLKYAKDCRIPLRAR